MFVVNAKGDNTFAKRKYNDEIIYEGTGKTIPSVYVVHPTNGESMLTEPRFPHLSNFYDGSRMSVNEGTGYRDALLARSPETYLMAAQAAARLSALGAGS